MKFNYFFLLFTYASILACPFTIQNDSASPIIITDNDKRAVYINPGQEAVIDPTLNGKLNQLFFNEKLNFLVQEEKSGNFFQKYQLTEYYCVKDLKKNSLKLSEIITLIKNPTDRLSVKEFTKQIPAHDNEHGH